MSKKYFRVCETRRTNEPFANYSLQMSRHCIILYIKQLLSNIQNNAISGHLEQYRIIFLSWLFQYLPGLYISAHQHNSPTWSLFYAMLTINQLKKNVLINGFAAVVGRAGMRRSCQEFFLYHVKPRQTPLSQPGYFRIVRQDEQMDILLLAKLSNRYNNVNVSGHLKSALVLNYSR